ncbi:hypothetical protein [Leifsonia sp. Leaf264]|uniref:hypothetical protein n=1 Tax=Leifsonia sp. Leaf264 TaxID=1736314 RepID=UPI0006F38332|nr:hypothetical protein [Leifsonia sp. Leaf264]KQO98291.1 hypothetical protein ASF30_09535 [Leifsonia sp. Leaf264]
MTATTAEPTLSTAAARDLKVREAFLDDTKNHRLTIVRDDGVYRHLYYGAPGTGWGSFNVITTPGALTVYGDTGTYVFERLDDMFEFFRGKRGINPHYWGEKMTASSDFKEHSVDAVMEFLDDTVTDWLDENADADDAWKQDLQDAVAQELACYADDDSELRRAIDQFQFGDCRFYDVWENDFTVYTHRFLWALWGIVTVIAQYDEQKAGS